MKFVVRLYLHWLVAALFLSAGLCVDSRAQQAVSGPAVGENPPSTEPNAPLTESESESGTISHKEIVSFGQDVVLKKNEVSRQVVVIGGDVDIEGTVEQDLVVVFGSAKVSGTLKRGMVVVLGSADFASSAKIAQDAVVIGGKLKLAPGAKIDGERIEIVLGERLPDLNWIGDWVMKGLLLARPLPPQFPWVWMVAGVFALIYMLIAVVFPQPVQACVNALETRPAGSFFAGILGLVLFGPVVFLLLISVAGILVIPILLLALLVAIFFGKVAIYKSTGQRLARQLHVHALQSPIIALLVGLVIFYLFYTIPVLGFLVWGFATAWGIGAVLVACFSNVHKEQEPAPILASPGAVAGTPPRVINPASPAAPPTLEAAPPSPEMVSLRRAGFWIRFWATMLDLILLGTLAAFLGPFFLLLWAAYHVAMWSWKGTTIGGIVLGIKVMRTDGTPVDFSVALVRSLSSFFSALVLFLGFFWAGWDRNKQSWHDKIAGTVMVKVPKGMALI